MKIQTKIKLLTRIEFLLIDVGSVIKRMQVWIKAKRWELQDEIKNC